MSGALRGGSFTPASQRGARGENFDAGGESRSAVPDTSAPSEPAGIIRKKKNGRLPIRGVPPAARVCPAPPGLALSGPLLAPPPSYPVSRCHCFPRAAQHASGKKRFRGQNVPHTPYTGEGPTKLTNVYGPPMAIVGPMDPILPFLGKKGGTRSNRTPPHPSFYQCLRAFRGGWTSPRAPLRAGSASTSQCSTHPFPARVRATYPQPDGAALGTQKRQKWQSNRRKKP